MICYRCRNKKYLQIMKIDFKTTKELVCETCGEVIGDSSAKVFPCGHAFHMHSDCLAYMWHCEICYEGKA